MKYNEIVQLLLSIIVPILIAATSWIFIETISHKTQLAVNVSKIAVLDQHTNDNSKNIALLFIKHAESFAKTERVDDRVTSINTLFEQKFDLILKRLDAIDKKLDRPTPGHS